MKKGDIVLVELHGGPRLYLRLVDIETTDVSTIVKYDRRMEVQLIPTKDPATGGHAIDTAMVNTGDILGISKSEPSELNLPHGSTYHLCAINPLSREYRDLSAAFSDIVL